MRNNECPAVLIFIEDGFEDMELMYPKYRLEEAGYKAVLAGPEGRKQYVGKHSYPQRSDISIADACEPAFVGVVCPGGWAPDKLRRLERTKELVGQFNQSRKLIAAICHGGWIPISAGVYGGVRVTGSLGIKDDLINAGATFEDSPVVVDRHFVSSRKPDDLPVFMAAVLELLASAPSLASSFADTRAR